MDPIRPQRAASDGERRVSRLHAPPFYAGDIHTNNRSTTPHGRVSASATIAQKEDIAINENNNDKTNEDGDDDWSHHARRNSFGKRRTQTESDLYHTALNESRGVGVCSTFLDYEGKEEFDGLIKRVQSCEHDNKVHIPDGGKEGADDEYSPWFSWRLFLAYTGPGWLMSVAYLDPGNIESDLQAGGYSGYQLLWVLLWSTLLGLAMQILAARLGAVSGHNLAENCRHFYSPAESRILWLMTQIAIIGSDIQEIMGSAIAFRVLFGIPLWAGCLITGLDTLTFLAIQVTGVRKLEAVFGVLILTMCVCFFATFVTQLPDGQQIAQGLFVPTVGERDVIQAVSIVGAIVMPHNIYLHSALVLSRDVDRSRPSKIKEANKYFALEATLALFVSLLINCAIVSVFAHAFYSDTCANISGALTFASGITIDPPFACVPTVDSSNLLYSEVICSTSSNVVGTCRPIGLQGAASALEGVLGSSARVLWAVGLLAAGQSSTMTGTFAGQFVMEGFLHLQVPNWARVLITRSVSLIPAMLVAFMANTDSLVADNLDEWLNVLQSVQLPFAVLPLLHFTGSEQVMGDFRNGKILTILGWSMGAFIIGINIYLVVSKLTTNESLNITYVVCMSVGSFLYFFFIWRIIRTDVVVFVRWCAWQWRSRWGGGPGDNGMLCACGEDHGEDQKCKHGRKSCGNGSSCEGDDDSICSDDSGWSHSRRKGGGEKQTNKRRVWMDNKTFSTSGMVLLYDQIEAHADDEQREVVGGGRRQVFPSYGSIRA